MLYTYILTNIIFEINGKSNTILQIIFGVFQVFLLTDIIQVLYLLLLKKIIKSIIINY